MPSEFECGHRIKPHGYISAECCVFVCEECNETYDVPLSELTDEDWQELRECYRRAQDAK